MFAKGHVDWSNLWQKLPEAMCKFRTTKYLEKGNGGREKQAMSKLAVACLEKLQAFDSPPVQDDLPYEQWLAAFDPDVTVFPDKLFEELSHFTGDVTTSPFYRLNRLRALSSSPQNCPSTTQDAAETRANQVSNGE